MDNTSRFSGKADSYQAARPGYPPELAGYLADLGMKGSQVADIGAGTGIFSRFLLEKLDCTVWAVEPNEEMRGKAEEELRDVPRFFSVKGTAEATGLDSQSVSFVTAAQAFHWFSPKAFREECLRILRPNGVAVLVWNSPNYDYMKVGDTQYFPVNEGGNSTFEIPVTAFDAPVTVIADTVAMSTPHEITYTLTFDSASVAETAA